VPVVGELDRIPRFLDTITLTSLECSDACIGASKILHRVQCNEIRAMAPNLDIRGWPTRSRPPDLQGRRLASTQRASSCGIIQTEIVFQTPSVDLR
jgi:hypothetical protein